jgi:hypothetical protein
MKNLFCLALVIIVNLRITVTISAQESLSQGLLPWDALLYNFNEYSQRSSPEKVFLHLDRNYFVAGDTIRFTGYLLTKSYMDKSEKSNYIYVEMLKGGSLIERVKIKNDEDGFSGYIPLNPGLESGDYIIRAYTLWMMNRDPGYMFHSGLKITGLAPDSPENIKTGHEQAIEKPELSVDFYPEGGRYFTGDLSVIGFKAVDSAGRGVNISGSLLNNEGECITDIKSEFDGMGSFIIMGKEDETYVVKVKRDDSEFHFTLPAVSESGASIKINYNSGVYYLNATSRNIEDTVKLIIHNGSEIIYNKPVSDYVVKIQEKNLTEGIYHALAITTKGMVLAERIFYKFSENNQVSLRFDKDKYGPREKVSVDMEVKDREGNPVVGKFSVSVVDGFFKEHLQEDNIVSYMNLSSEVKGRINSPQFYFNDSIPLNQRRRAMDLLMIVQGWRYYDIPALYNGTALKDTIFKKELTQSISGTVNGISDRAAKDYTLSLFSPDIAYSGVFENMSGKKFRIDGFDFPDGTKFMVRVTGKNGRSTILPKIDKEIFAPEKDYQSLYYMFSKEAGYQRNYNDFPAVAPEKQREPDDEKTLQNDMNKYLNRYGKEKERVLDSVVVKDRRMVKISSNISPYGQRYFEPRQVRKRKDMERDDNMSLADYIVTNFPGFFVRGGSVYSMRGGSVGSTTTFKDNMAFVTNKVSYTSVPVYINSIKSDTTESLQEYSVRDISTLVVLRGNEGALYKSNWGVIMFELRKGGDDMYKDIDNSKNTNTIIYPFGWQKPVRFYSPKYENEEERKNPVPDQRNTIYWNPSVSTDSSGRANFIFYTPDSRTGSFVLVINGIDSSLPANIVTRQLAMPLNFVPSQHEFQH